MSQESQLVTREESLANAQEPSDQLGNMLAIIERAAKDPTVDIDKMERLLAMGERMQEKASVQAFNGAFAKLQRELPVIVADSVIPNRGKYARFEDVMRQIQGALTENGFSVSFEQRADDKRITVICHLRHIRGHSSDTPFGVRLGGKADSETQADCKASTTAKRNALLQALNIVVRQDAFQDEDDPHNESGLKITQQQADELRELCEHTHADRAKFLGIVSADKFEDIPADRFEELEGILLRRKK